MGLSFFTLAVLLLTRYIFKSFLIKITSNNNGSFDLTVTECRGKDGRDKVTVCRVALKNVERVVLKTKENEKELRNAQKGRKIFSYCPDLCPERVCFVFVTECGEPLLLKISPDDTLLTLLESAQSEK